MQGPKLWSFKAFWQMINWRSRFMKMEITNFCMEIKYKFNSQWNKMHLWLLKKVSSMLFPYFPTNEFFNNILSVWIVPCLTNPKIHNWVHYILWKWIFPLWSNSSGPFFTWSFFKPNFHALSFTQNPKVYPISWPTTFKFKVGFDTTMLVTTFLVLMTLVI